jgi:hypothetical protein
VPWTTILSHAPSVLDAARGLRRSAAEAPAAEPADGDVETLARALERLQERQEEQVALVSDLARQVGELTAALEVLRARLRLALSGAAIAVALAILALILGR